MNNVCDEEGFGRKNVFNTENEVDHTWAVTKEKITFPAKKNWMQYVDSRRLEIENTTSEEEGLKWAARAYQASYGYEYPEIIYQICLHYILRFSDEIHITKHNIRKCDAMEYIDKGTFEMKLKELFPELGGKS